MNVVTQGLLTFALLMCASAGAAADTASRNAAFREIYKELVEINTTDSVGDTLDGRERDGRAAARAPGCPKADVQVLGPDPRKGNLVARLRGTGIAQAAPAARASRRRRGKREDWSFDPFMLARKDGYFYGRGTVDDKAMAATFVANLIRYMKEGFKPDRDIILALTADEELSARRTTACAGC